MEIHHDINVPPTPPAHVIRALVIEDITGTTRNFGELTTTPLIHISNVVLRNIDVTVIDSTAPHCRHAASAIFACPMSASTTNRSG